VQARLRLTSHLIRGLFNEVCTGEELLNARPAPLLPDDAGEGEQKHEELSILDDPGETHGDPHPTLDLASLRARQSAWERELKHLPRRFQRVVECLIEEIQVIEAEMEQTPAESAVNGLGRLCARLRACIPPVSSGGLPSAPESPRALAANSSLSAEDVVPVVTAMIKELKHHQEQILTFPSLGRVHAMSCDLQQGMALLRPVLGWIHPLALHPPKA